MDWGEHSLILDKELHIRLMENTDFDLMAKWLNDQRVLEFLFLVKGPYL